MLYAISVYVQKDEMSKHAAGHVYAKSREEAESKCVLMALDKYPIEGGWRNHDCVANRIEVEFEITKVTTFHESF